MSDASLAPETWTGHTGCVILAPHLTALTKKELGLPAWEEADERRRRDDMCWSSLGPGVAGARRTRTRGQPLLLLPGGPLSGRNSLRKNRKKTGTDSKAGAEVLLRLKETLPKTPSSEETGQYMRFMKRLKT